MLQVTPGIPPKMNLRLEQAAKLSATAPEVFDITVQKTSRSLLDGWMPMVLHVVMVHDNCFGFSVADTCCAGAVT